MSVPLRNRTYSVAWAAVLLLWLTVGALSFWLGLPFSIVAAAYLVMNFLYSHGLRDQVLLDVFFIALGFVLRAIAGVELLRPLSPATALSPWLLVCTFFGALFLALAKRRRELANSGEDTGRRRAVPEQQNGRDQRAGTGQHVEPRRQPVIGERALAAQLRAADAADRQVLDEPGVPPVHERAHRERERDGILHPACDAALPLDAISPEGPVP